MYSRSPETPFYLAGTLNNRPLESLLERFFSLKKLARLYKGLAPSRDEGEFLQQLFDTFNINYQVAEAELARIPKIGPLVIVANHPFGCVEGVVMAAMLRRVRPDVKIMANFLLKRIPEVRDLFIAVDPFGGNGATRSNIGPMKEALRWLKQGGLLLVFPAGEVSHLNPFKRAVEDSPWSHTIGRLVQIAQAPVQPAYFHGANSLLFQLAGFMHPRLRTAMLPRELINKANTTIPIRIGAVQPWNRLKEIEGEAALIDYLRMRTYEEVSDLIAEIEPDNKGIPILLRQYLKLGGQILEFNVDDQFNNALDGLIMLDLLQTEPKTLAKYMGKNEVAQFHAGHRVDESECA